MTDRTAMPRPAQRLGSAIIIPFPIRSGGAGGRAPSNRLGLRDRIETLTWAAMVATPSGYSRVNICNGGPDPEIGDFVLIYEDGREWASYGVSRDGPRFCAWPTSGAAGILGRFDTLREARDAVMAQPRRRRRSRALHVR